MWSCWRNFLTTIKVPPYQTDERLLLLSGLQNTNQLHDTKFRIGFKLYKISIDKANKDTDLWKYQNLQI